MNKKWSLPRPFYSTHIPRISTHVALLAAGCLTQVQNHSLPLCLAFGSELGGKGLKPTFSRSSPRCRLKLVITVMLYCLFFPSLSCFPLSPHSVILSVQSHESALILESLLGDAPEKLATLSSSVETNTLGPLTGGHEMAKAFVKDGTDGTGCSEDGSEIE